MMTSTGPSCPDVPLCEKAELLREVARGPYRGAHIAADMVSAPVAEVAARWRAELVDLSAEVVRICRDPDVATTSPIAGPGTLRSQRQQGVCAFHEFRAAL